jgi:multidrug efflux pump
MKAITTIALNKNRVTFLAYFLIALIGIQAYFSLSRAEDPSFVIRTAVVKTALPGASPERVENLITDKIEKTVKEMPQLDYVRSETKSGFSIVYVYFKDEYKDIEPVFEDLRKKIDDIKNDMPSGTIGPVVDDEFGDVYGIIYALTGDGFSYPELYDMANEFRDDILQLDNASKVDILGNQQERVYINYDIDKIAALGLTTVELNSILENQNILISGGAIEVNGESIAIEPSGSFNSIQAIENTVISDPKTNQIMLLKDIATVKRGFIDPATFFIRYNQTPCLALAVSTKKGGNVTELGANLRELFSKKINKYPLGIEYEEIFFQPDLVNKTIDNFISNLVQAVTVVFLVMIVFLGLKTSVIVASLIPMSMLLTLLIMNMLGIGLNQVSLAALIISLGMLVDSGVVMVELILVKLEKGSNAFVAAQEASDELGFGLLSASLTSAFAFLPTYLAKSTTGEFMAPLFQVVTITLLSAWIIAITLIPLLCLVAFKKGVPAQKSLSFFDPIQNVYVRSLKQVLKKPILYFCLTIFIFFISLQGFKLIPSIFFPQSENPFFTAKISLPVGTSLDETIKVVDDMESFLKTECMSTAEHPDGVSKWTTFIGQGPPRFNLSYNPEQSSSEIAVFLIHVNNYKIIPGLIKKLEHYIDNSFYDVTHQIRSLSKGPPVMNPVEIRLSGKEPKKLFQVAQEIKFQLGTYAGTKQTKIDWGDKLKKIILNIDEERAYKVGLSNKDIAISLQSALSGIEVSEYRENTDIIPIIFREKNSRHLDISSLEQLPVSSQFRSKSVPLGQVATVSLSFDDAKIIRRDQLRTITISCDLIPGVTALEIVQLISPWINNQQQQWPPSFKYAFGGEVESSQKANNSIKAELPIAIFAIIFILVLQFNSIRKTSIILITVPLALIGVVIGLIVAKSYFGFVTLLGIISLSGIVINDGIVLLECIENKKEQNITGVQAIIDSGKERLRPILLTTITTTLGLVPLWIGGGEMWKPMAISIIFGLIFATVLTLIVVPVLYSILFNHKHN